MSVPVTKSRHKCRHCEPTFNRWWGSSLLASSAVQHLERTIVTGASSNHFKCLRNLLFSLERCCPGNRVMVYDLGLSAAERDAIAQSALALRTFDFDRYPPYFDIAVNCGEYAWKPVIVHEVLDEFGGLVMWLDAGNLVLEDLAPLWGNILRHGIVTPQTPGDLRLWTHPRTLALLSAPEEDLCKANRNAALVGLNGNCDSARQLCVEWKDAAMCRECIAPPGSGRSNHRQDQAVLSVLYYRHQREQTFAPIDKVRQVSFHNDELSTEDVKNVLLR